MIDNEMSCSPNPQWLEDFKKEIQEEFKLSSLDAVCIAGKVAKIVRKRDRKACEWLGNHADDYYESICQAYNCYYDSELMIEALRKMMKE